MAIQTRTYKWMGLCATSAQTAIPSIVFTEIRGGANLRDITYDDDEENGGSNVVDVDAFMATQGWGPA